MFSKALHQPKGHKLNDKILFREFMHELRQESRVDGNYCVLLIFLNLPSLLHVFNLHRLRIFI